MVGNLYLQAEKSLLLIARAPGVWNEIKLYLLTPPVMLGNSPLLEVRWRRRSTAQLRWINDGNSISQPEMRQ
ncbi:unnamed protein product [Clavelina lepadiformis]|uniref:Uncharacterized protein n=1 Tax=Clavelina lepadiformis TaxID=159417 RepID=A0ABP0FNA7_CLALP